MPASDALPVAGDSEMIEEAKDEVKEEPKQEDNMFARRVKRGQNKNKDKNAGPVDSPAKNTRQQHKSNQERSVCSFLSYLNKT